MSAPLSAAAAPGAPWPAVTLSASAKPSQAPPGATVTYTDARTNTGDVRGVGHTADARVAHRLHLHHQLHGIYRDDILISRTEPTIVGPTLNWSGLTVRPSAQRWLFRHQHDGAGTLRHRLHHLAARSRPQPDGRRRASAKQLFYGITSATTTPQPCWIDYVNAAYDRGLMPVIRLAGIHGGSFWHKPQPDGPGNYTEHRPGICRAAAGLPGTATVTR